MPRPRTEHPTQSELKILEILWRIGPATVRDVIAHLNDGRAYTSVMSLMNVMADKGLLKRTPRGKAYLYSPKTTRQRTMTELVGDLVKRAFEGSASALVAHLLEKSSPEELKE